jgi:hypothetical protein
VRQRFLGMIWGKPVWVGAITPLQARAVRVPYRRHLQANVQGAPLALSLLRSRPQGRRRGFFEEAMFDDEAVRGVVYGIAIAAAIWLLAWALGS